MKLVKLLIQKDAYKSYKPTNIGDILSKSSSALSSGNGLGKMVGRFANNEFKEDKSDKPIKDAFVVTKTELKINNIEHLYNLALAYKEGDAARSINKHPEKYAICLALIIFEQGRKSDKSITMKYVDELAAYFNGNAEMTPIIVARKSEIELAQTSKNSSTKSYADAAKGGEVKTTPPSSKKPTPEHSQNSENKAISSSTPTGNNVASPATPAVLPSTDLQTGINPGNVSVPSATASSPLPSSPASIPAPHRDSIGEIEELKVHDLVENADSFGSSQNVTEADLDKLEAAMKASDQSLKDYAAEQDKQAKLAEEKAEQDKQAKLAADKAEQDKQAKLAADKAEQDKQAKLAADKAEQDKQAKLAADKAEQDKQAKLAADKAEQDKQAKLAADKAEQDKQAKLAADKAEQDKQAKLAADKAEQDKQAKLAADKAEQDKQAKLAEDKAEQDKQAKLAEDKAEQERQAKLAAISGNSVSSSSVPSSSPSPMSPPSSTQNKGASVARGAARGPSSLTVPQQKLKVLGSVGIAGSTAPVSAAILPSFSPSIMSPSGLNKAKTTPPPLPKSAVTSTSSPVLSSSGSSSSSPSALSPQLPKSTGTVAPSSSKSSKKKPGPAQMTSPNPSPSPSALLLSSSTPSLAAPAPSPLPAKGESLAAQYKKQEKRGIFASVARGFQAFGMMIYSLLTSLSLKKYRAWDLATRPLARLEMRRESFDTTQAYRSRLNSPKAAGESKLDVRDSKDGKKVFVFGARTQIERMEFYHSRQKQEAQKKPVPVALEKEKQKKTQSLKK